MFDGVDLTGECYLQSYHTDADLFSQPNQSSLDKSQKGNASSQDLDIDFESITLRIKINEKLEKFSYKADKKFYDVLKTIAERKNIQVSDVLLFDEKDKRILAEQTPNDVNFKFSSIYSK